VDGKAVDMDELVYLLSKGKNTDTPTAGVSREEFEENLDLFINYKLKVREAESLGLDQTEEFSREFDSFKETLIYPYLIKNSLEEGELRKAYSRMQEVVRASHILFQFPPNASSEDSLIVLKMALKVRGEIENGGSINELAVQYSEDPSAKVNKGDLGYFTSLQMVQPFEDAAYNLQVGQLSDPVLSSFGYHIIQVHSGGKCPKKNF
jgi:peptidyl-prolyl cis-trans isomerase SurA